MKTSRKNQDAVTIKDLETEILNLRIGIANITEVSAQFSRANHRLVLDQRALNAELATCKANLADATAEVDRQQEYQSRAHETIELLVKKMPYAPGKA
jgi:hypothetical protein